MQNKFNKLGSMTALFCWVVVLFGFVSPQVTLEVGENTSTELIEIEETEGIRNRRGLLTRSRVEFCFPPVQSPSSDLDPLVQILVPRETCLVETKNQERDSHNGLGTYLRI